MSSAEITEQLTKRNLVSGITQIEVANILSVLKNIQAEMESYEKEYDLFTESVSRVNLKDYFSATNKEAYIESLTNLEKSSFNIINNFIVGRYAGFIEGMEKILINLS